MQNSLLERLEYLESRVAFQDDTIEQLNQELAEQQKLQEKMRRQLDAIINKLREAAPSQIASQAEETPPPHY
ncbi:MAG: SlyX family protein [Aeromonadaceae bacterium]|nr:SlyX family protein [Aeromonadaceae bacterium]